MKALLAAGLALTVLLAGCSGKGKDTPEDDVKFDDLGLQATSSTGIIRGVVVDDAIRPIAGATVKLTGGTERSTTSSATGTFGFDELAPGTYFLEVSKVGFFAAQQSADVVAGVAEPAIVKVLLQVDAANLPYVESYVFEGFIQCSGTFVAVSFAACSAVNIVGDITGTGNVTDDNFGVNYLLSKKPTYLQAEMVWESTQALGGEMSVMFSWGCDTNGGFLCDFGAAGTSPVIVRANATDVDEINGGDYNQTIFVRAFNEGLQETQVVGGGLGATIQQRFTIFTTAFYGYAPPETWALSNGDDIPPPQ